MEQSGSAKLVSIVALVFGLIGLFFTATVYLGAWNYSAEGASLAVGAVAGLIAAGIGAARLRSEGSTLNSIALALGVLSLGAGLYMLVTGDMDVAFG